MKKVIKTLILMLVFLLPIATLFAGCGGTDDGDVMGFVARPKSSALVVNEYNEINLEHGRSYSINKNSFTYYAEYASGKKQIKDTSNVSFSTNFPTDGIAPLGSYNINISYDNYSCYFVINVNKTVAKPVADVNSFVYNGAEQMPEITGVDYTYMVPGGQYIGAEAMDDYFIDYMLNPYCMWEDGTTETYRISWKILPCEIPTPTFETITFDPYNYSFDIRNYITNSEMFESIPAFDFQHDLDFGNVENRAGEHNITCEIMNRNYAFAGGVRSVVGKFKINVLYIDIPTFITEFNYTGNLQNAQIEGDWIQGVYMVGGTDAKYLGTYHTNFALNDSSSMRWTGIEDFEYGEYITPNIMKVNNFTLKVKWSINPNLVTKPTLVAEEIVFDSDWHNPLSYESNEGMEFNYNDVGFGYGNNTEYDAGEYKVEVRLRYGYVWSDTKTSENLVFNWKIKQADLLAPGEGRTGYDEWQVPGGVSAKTTFDISKIYLPFGFDFSTFESEEELEAIIGESVTFTDNTFTDSNGIVWVKSVKGDKTTISQSFDLSGKSLGEKQLAYATYYSTNENFFNKKGIAFDIDIEKKGSQWIDFHLGSKFPSVYTYGDVITLDDTQVSIRSGEGYKLQYRYISKDDSGKTFTYYHNSLDTWVEVGEYKLWLDLEGNDDYEVRSEYIHEGISFTKKVLTDENLAGVNASNIHRLEPIGLSSFVGSVMHNGRAVEGTFEWVDETIKPALSDSNLTEYEYIFTPTNKNYVTYQSAITLTVERSIVHTKELPFVGRVRGGSGYSHIFEGDVWADCTFNTSKAWAKNYVGQNIEGTWELIVPKNKTYVDGEFAIKFIPTDQERYQDCLFDNISGDIAWYYNIKDIMYTTTTPEFILYYEGKHYSHVESATVVYTNKISGEYYQLLDFDNFTINDKGDGTYTLSYLGYTSSEAFSYSNFIVVNTEYDFLNYLLYHYEVTLDENTIVVVGKDLVIDDSMLGNSNSGISVSRVLVPDDVTLDIKSSAYLRTAGLVDILDTNVDVHSLSNTFYNFGELKFNDVSGNLELRNYGTTSIEISCLDYFSFVNGKDATINVKTYVDTRPGSATDINYETYGDFENHGTFNYIYYYQPEESALPDSSSSENLFRFYISRESVNTGTLNGLFTVGKEDLDINSGSKIDGWTKIYYINSKGDVDYKNKEIIIKDLSVALEERGEVTVNAETPEDLALGFDLMKYLDMVAEPIVKVVKDIDISSSPLFNDFNRSETGKASLHVYFKCKLVVSAYVILNLGEKVLGLQYSPLDSAKGQLHVYGTLIGDVVCEVDKSSSDTELYIRGDYITMSVDGVVQGTVWQKDDYLEANPL